MIERGIGGVGVECRRFKSTDRRNGQSDKVTKLTVEVGQMLHNTTRSEGKRTSSDAVWEKWAVPVICNV